MPIASIVDEKQLAGAHTFSWEATDSGMYWVQVMADREMYMKQIIKT
jgi:hypothetical protein